MTALFSILSFRRFVGFSFIVSMMLVGIAVATGVTVTARAFTLPDFTVGEITLRPSPLDPGHSYTFLADILNISPTTRAQDPSAAQIFLDVGDDGTLDVVSIRRNVTPLAAVTGHHLMTWNNDSVGWVAVEGRHRAMICAGLPQEGEGEGFLDDANPDNNCVDFAFTVGDVEAVERPWMTEPDWTEEVKDRSEEEVAESSSSASARSVTTQPWERTAATRRLTPAASSSSSFSRRSTMETRSALQGGSSSASSERVPTGRRFADDVPDWAADAIDEQAELGIIQGYADGRFGAADPVTRGQVATLMYRIMRHAGIILSAPAGCLQFYDDARPDHYAYIPLCALRQFTRLDQATFFQPDQPASRGDMAVLVARIVGDDLLASQGITRGQVLAAMSAFPDVLPTDDVYEPAMLLRATGIIEGYPDGRFGHHDTLNRAQAAIIMQRILRVLRFFDQGDDSASGNETSSSSSSSTPTASPVVPTRVPTRTPQTPLIPSSNSAATLPDFQIVTFDVPDTAVEGNAFLFTAAVRNAGNANAGRSLLRLDIDANADGTVEWNRVQTFASFPAGASQSLMLTAGNVESTFPWLSAIGQYKITLCLNIMTEEQEALREVSYSNNCASEIISIVPFGVANPPAPAAASGTPDYAVTTEVVYGTSTDGPFRFSAFIRNVGDGAALRTSSAIVSIDEDDDGTVDYESSGAEILSVDTLGPGGSMIALWDQNNLDWVPVAGTHRVNICVNPGHEVLEVNGANNCVSETIEVMEEPAGVVPDPAALPNFHVRSIATQKLPSGKYRALMNVENTGASSSVVTTTKVWLTLNGSSVSNTLRYLETPVLLPDGAGFSYLLPWDIGYLANLTYVIHACANTPAVGGSAVTETDTLNNCAAVTFTVR